MLELRPNCERCDCDLRPDGWGAYICTFECTFCGSCKDHFHGVCPNCGGELVPRPVRPTELLDQFPGSIERVTKPHE